MIDAFLIQYCEKLSERDFTFKTEKASGRKKGKREYLNDVDSKFLIRELNGFFESNVEIPRIKHGNKQTLDTLINEETLLLAKYLRNEMEEWKPRIPNV